MGRKKWGEEPRSVTQKGPGRKSRKQSNPELPMAVREQRVEKIESGPLGGRIKQRARKRAFKAALSKAVKKGGRIKQDFSTVPPPTSDGESPAPDEESPSGGAGDSSSGGAGDSSSGGDEQSPEPKVKKTKVKKTNVEKTKVKKTNVKKTNVEKTKVEKTKVKKTKVEKTKVEKSSAKPATKKVTMELFKDEASGKRLVYQMIL